MLEIIATVLVSLCLVYCGFKLGINESVRILSDKYISDRSAELSTKVLIDLAENGVVDSEAVMEYYNQKKDVQADVREENTTT